ncbi:choice-of-anchor J domain-containing protein [Bacteroides eggerthii]|uniref:choice-of-anchor J domain-containing protein n=1 Tax=Bacteroides eggerthii TaxID=28111 RepID=UPI00197BD200|nr:choice-of-anchor J domain-containing protein [Bacteroides eggerthii]
MKKKIFASIALLALLTACDDHYDDQFNINPGITDVKDIAMTLETSDYGSISKLTANQELALSKDPEGKTFVKALEAVGTNHYFTEEAPAEDYVPAYLKSKYPNADAGSKFVVTYKLFSPSDYMDDFKKLSTYDLTEEDYKTVWGESVKASFLSPSTLKKIPALLTAAVSNPTDGEMKVVNYAYSNLEPSSGEGLATVYQLTKTLDQEGGRYVIAAKGKDGKYYPFGKLDKDSYSFGYMNPAPIAVGENNVISTEDGSGWVITIAKSANGYTMLNPLEKYIYQQGTYNSFNVSSKLPDEGAEWAFKSNGDGTFAVSNVEKGKTIKLTYTNSKFSFGSYPADMFEGKVYWTETVAENDGGFKVHNVSDGGAPGAIWTYDSKYKYWKATGYIKGDNYATESYLISPEIDLTTANNPQLSFDAALNYLKGADASAVLGVKVSEDYTGDYATATWEDVEVPNWPAGNSWDMVNTGGIDLSEFKGKKIHFALKYTSTDKGGTTWEMKNFLVEEKNDYWDVSLYKEILDNDVVETRSLAATRATTVSPTASALYVYDGENKTWKPYTLKEAKLLVAEPALYESLGADMIEKPEAVLPTYLKQKYPYAAVGDMVAVVYNKKADTPVVAEYTLGEDWTETTSCKLVTATFTQDAEGISVEASMYLNETFKTDKGSFTIQDVFLEGVKWVWSKSSYNGKDFMKASAYIKATGNNPAESWLVSPVMNFKKSKAPELLFEHACRFRTETPSDNLNVMVSTDYSDDVKTATWTALTVENWPEDNSQYPFASNKIDLSAYNGQKVTIAFKYVSTKDVAPTWEVANVVVREKVTEGEGEEGGDAETPAE